MNSIYIDELKYFVDGQWLDSKTEKYMPVYNPSTGEVIAETPCCTAEEVEQAIQSELGVPVKYIGVGEGIDDLQKFDSDEFVNALFNVEA